VVFLNFIFHTNNEYLEKKKIHHFHLSNFFLSVPFYDYDDPAVVICIQVISQFSFSKFVFLLD
jgi:hypothetical protein